MINGYSRASKFVVPAVRSVIAQELKSRYSLTEEEIARHLGVAQAAVSKYLKGKYSDHIKKMEALIDRSSISAYINEISKGKSEYVSMIICNVCAKENGFGCRFSKV